MKMTKEEAKKLAKEGIEHSEKYNIPLKKKKKRNRLDITRPVSFWYGKGGISINLFIYAL